MWGYNDCDGKTKGDTVARQKQDFNKETNRQSTQLSPVLVQLDHSPSLRRISPAISSGVPITSTRIASSGGSRISNWLASSAGFMK